MRLNLKHLCTLFLVLLFQWSFSQEKNISGTITSAKDGLPLPGVNVLLKGTLKGTQTDFNGKFTSKVKEGETLVISFIGFKSVETKIGASNTYDIALEEDIASLEEVIVLGYSKTSKLELTGAVSQVTSKQIEQTPVVNVDQALQGKVPGLVFNNYSGTPGSNGDIRIRGISSITAGNSPLFVIDGVPVVSGDISATSSSSSLSVLSSININDVESISVLKDASATAAYGARGANGVIVITTKSGKSGKTVVDFKTSYGFANDATDGPTVLTGAQREELFYEAIYNTYGTRFNFPKEGAKAFYESNTGTFGDAYVNWNAAGRPEAHWDRVITNKNAPIQDYSLSASGGNDNSTFHVSLGNLKQESTVIGSDFERISGALNFSRDLTDKLKLTMNNSLSNVKQDGTLEFSAYFSNPRAVKYFMPPLDQPYNADGSLNLNTSLPNPLYISENGIKQSKYTRLLSNSSLKWLMPVKNLSFTTVFNADWQVYTFKSYDDPYYGDGSSTNGQGYQAFINRANYVFQNYFDYLWELSDSQEITFKALQEFQKNRLYSLSGEGDNFTDGGLTNLDSAGNTKSFSNYNDWSNASYMGQIHYSGFSGKYVIDGTYRREGSSRFSPDNRWGNFWAVGGAWNIFKEAFFKNNVVDNLKFRASYGTTGNSEIGLNQYQALLSYNSKYAGEGASYPGTFGNSELSWEKSETFDVGLDFGIFNSRITGSASYYRRETKDLLLNVPLSQTTGFASQTRNIGRMENKGLELELNLNIVRTDDFNISLGGYAATNKNQVLELAKDINGKDIEITTGTRKVTVGKPVNAWYIQEWKEVDPATGKDLYYADEDRNTTTDEYNKATRLYQGNKSALPTLTGGLNFHVDYKGFFVDANAYYSGGNLILQDWSRYTNGTDFYTTSYGNGIDVILDRWQQPGDTGKRYGKFEATYLPWRTNSKFLSEGDYARLKNLTFGYNFKNNILDVVGLKSGSLFIKGTNLFTWVKDKNLKFDPETGISGITEVNTPPVKSVILGLNVKF